MANTPKPTSPATTPDDRQPYTLESANLTSEIDRQRLAALSELDAIDAAMLDIETRANQDIATIRGRADVEINARKSRADDLNKLVAIANRALDLPPLAKVTHVEPAAPVAS